MSRPRRLCPGLGRAIAALTIAASALTVGCRSSDAGRPARDWAKYPAVVTLTGVSGIDVLGDVHGDPEVTTRVLAAAGLITTSAPHHWTAADRVLVVTGDVIDKGSAATPIIDLFISLETEAAAAGGRVVVTLGNHEAEFIADPTTDKTKEFRDELRTLGLDPAAVAAGQSKYGAWLLTRPVAALVDDWFFCHAGYTAGMTALEIAQAFEQRFDQHGTPDFNHPFLTGADSLLESELWWTSGANATSAIDFNLAVLPASHLVFGHEPGPIDFAEDPQGPRAMGEMAMRFGGRIFLVDVGMSYSVGYSSGALMRIVRNPDSATAIYPDGTSRALWP